jgi:DNA-binding MarR family transcriptional regulator
MQVSSNKDNVKARYGSAKAATKPLNRRESLEREFSTAVIAFHESIAARLGLSAAEWKCLGVLEAGAMTAGRLAELSGFTSGGITAIVDRLERAKLVRRQANRADRRSVLIVPMRLESVRERVAPVFDSLRKAMTAVADSFTPAQLAAIESYFAQAIYVLHAETGKTARRRMKHSQNIRGSGR